MGQPEVQGRVIKMELDTGSTVSVLPYKQSKERFGHMKLAKGDITLKTYTGEKTMPKGEIVETLSNSRRPPSGRPLRALETRSRSTSFGGKNNGKQT